MKEGSQSPDSQTSIFLFVDTNFFIQLRVPKDLPWSDISPNGRIILFVPRAVQKEISRLKSDGNSRRSKRARTAAALLMRIAQSLGETELVQQHGPEVELRLAPRSPVGITVNSELDPNSTDDNIIGEVLAFQAANQGSDVGFLTTDSDQVLSAKHFGIKFLPIPESWHLPPEPDERDKRIEEQRRRIAELEETEPRIEIGVFDSSEDPIEELSLSVLEFPALSEEIVNRLVSEATRRIPLVEGLDELIEAKLPKGIFETSLLAADSLSRFKPPTKEEVAAYRAVEYPGWVERIRSYFRGLHEKLGLESRAGEMKITLRNNGSRSAEGLIVTFQALGGLLFSKIEDRLAEPPLPRPPEPPRGRIVRTRSALDIGAPLHDRDLLPRLPTPGPLHDPYAFYWKEGRGSPSDRWSFECDLFRHGGQEESFDLPFSLPVKAKAQDGFLRVEVFARNLSQTMLVKVPVKVSSRQADASAVAMMILDRQLPTKPPGTVSLEL